MGHEAAHVQRCLALMLEESENRKRCSMMDDSDSDNEGTQPAELPPMPDFADLIESEVLHQEEEVESQSKILCGKATVSSATNLMHVDFQPSGNKSTNKFNESKLNKNEH